MYEDLFESVEITSTSKTSPNFDRLTADEKKDVIEFIEWLSTTTMTKNSVNSYKSNMTKALLKHRGVIAGELTNDEKSAVRKFKAWHSTIVVDDVDVELEDLEA
jgi:hypothetical protein